MAFINERLPQRILSGLAISPRWHTTEIPMDNGNEIVNADWLYPKMEARAPLGIYTAADRQTLLNMTMACRGKLHAFRVKNPLDYVANVQPLISVGGVTYLAKAYTFGSETATRPIFAPVTASLTTGTVDLNTGICTGAVAGVDTWTGTFDMWMRFGDDWNPITAVTKDVWDVELELVERWRFA
jgi:uncharacterized protein (TIGR02217 family)